MDDLTKVVLDTLASRGLRHTAALEQLAADLVEVVRDNLSNQSADHVRDGKIVVVTDVEAAVATVKVLQSRLSVLASRGSKPAMKEGLILKRMEDALNDATITEGEQK